MRTRAQTQHALAVAPHGGGGLDRFPARAYRREASAAARDGRRRRRLRDRGADVDLLRVCLPSAPKTTLHTHLVVREDAHVLFGFGTERERSLFRELIKVSNVGPRIALAILSGVSVEDFQRCVEPRTSRRWCASRASAARRPSGWSSRCATGCKALAAASPIAGERGARRRRPQRALRGLQRADRARLQAGGGAAAAQGGRSGGQIDRRDDPTRAARGGERLRVSRMIEADRVIGAGRTLRRTSHTTAPCGRRRLPSTSGRARSRRRWRSSFRLRGSAATRSITC